MLSSIAMVQKYLGHLLYNQRNDKEIVLFGEEDLKKFPLANLKSMLAQELMQNKVVRSAHFSKYKTNDHGDAPHGQQKKGGNQRIDMSTVDLILHDTVYYLSGTYDEAREKESNDQNYIEFELASEWKQAQQRNIKDKSQFINFWCFFVVTRDCNDFKLCYTYYLPKFKQTRGRGNEITNTAVKSKLGQFALLLRSRVKKLLLLKDISQKRMKKDVKLEGMARKYQCLVDNMIRY